MAKRVTPAKRRPVQRAAPDPGTPSRTLTTELFTQLRADILHCRLEPGRRLLFRDLRKRYNSGLSPLREALMRLVADGLVMLEDHKGFRVAPVSLAEMTDLANTLVELEALAIRQAIENGDDRWEGALLARYHELSKREAIAADGSLDPEWEARNVAFHESLYAACGSPSLMFLCRLLSERFSRYRRRWARHADRGREVLKEHHGMLQAALKRDAGQAIVLLRKHRRATMDEIRSHWTDE